MTRQINNTWISAAVIIAAALLLLGLSSLGGAAPAAVPTPPAAAAPAGPVVGQEVTTPSGLKYIERVIGTGAQPSATSKVVVHYEGFLDNGVKFDSSRDRGGPATFPINGVIAGFSEGLATMKVGGKRTLLIPANLGYAAQGNPPSVPPNANLRFELELVGLQ